MVMRGLGVALLAAMALPGCARKEAATAEAPAADEAAIVDEAAADAAAEAADVYAAPAAFELAAIRTKDALTAAADAAFVQVDADASGALSQTEFYALAALMAPVEDDVVEDVYETAADDAQLPADAIDAPDSALPEEPSADSSALDQSYAAMAGADGNLTSEDLRAALIARFDAADANLDGALDETESASFAGAPFF